MQASLYFFTTFLTDSISLKLVDIVSLARPGGTPNEFGTPKVAAPEPAFIKKNAKKWQHFEAILKGTIKVSPDEQAEVFVELTDDLAYSQTFFPNSKITQYHNIMISCCNVILL